MDALAIEEARYNVVEKDGKFEIRDYTPPTSSPNPPWKEILKGLARHLENLLDTSPATIGHAPSSSMPAPVSEKPTGEKIGMTASVGQQRVQEKWGVSFIMPASYTLEILPKPEDREVTVRQVPARRMAAVRLSGTSSNQRYLQHKMELEWWIHKSASPSWAILCGLDTIPLLYRGF